MVADMGTILSTRSMRPDSTCGSDWTLCGDAMNDRCRPKLSQGFRVAALSGVLPAIDYHIRRGDDVNGRDLDGQTPLFLAASRGHLEACIVLLEAGAAPNVKDNRGDDIVAAAAAGGHRDVVAWLETAILVANARDAFKQFSPPLPGDAPSRRGPSETALHASPSAGTSVDDTKSALADMRVPPRTAHDLRTTEVAAAGGGPDTPVNDGSLPGVRVNSLSRIGRLIARGKQLRSQTHTDANEHLLPEIEYAESIERIVTMLNKALILGEEPPDEMPHCVDFKEDSTGDSSVDAAVDFTKAEQLRELVHNALASLSSREAKVLRMRFGIDMTTGHTVAEVARQFDVSPGFVRKLETRALERLRHPCRANSLRSFLSAD